MDDKRTERVERARQANYWLTKRDAGLMTREDEADLADWLRRHPSHAAAFEQAGALFGAIAQLDRAAGAERSPPSRRRRHARPTPRALRHTMIGLRGAVAACAAALIVMTADLPMRLRADIVAATGETRHVALPDGSSVLLDSGSAISVDYGRERRIDLLRGQAAFTVAADPAHPFVVAARSGATTALGTRFIVSRIEAATRVTVTEHSVEIVQGGERRIVPAGSSAAYDGGHVSAPATVRTADVDAWTRGRVRFVDRPLREVVAELGRYHRGYLGMIGGSLGDLPVNGVFPTDDPVAALDMIERALRLGSYRISDRVILLHR